MACLAQCRARPTKGNMLLTQLSTVKGRLNIDDSVDDTLLVMLINGAAGRFERECNRKFDRAVNATYEFPADTLEIIPERYPIESVSSLELKSSEATGWVPQEVDYIIYRKSVISLLNTLGGEREVARVTYTAGYVLPGTVPDAGQEPLPAEIEFSCIEQVAYWYQNRHRLGLVSVSGEGGAIQQFAQLDLLPHVKAVLKSHERYIL